jgi:multicomponent Na+:H+ antiporter subunit E
VSPRTTTRRDGRTRPVRHRAVQPFSVLWLTLVWTVLWRDLTPLIVLSGVLVAVAVCLVFPLPPVTLFARVRPVPLALLAGGFAVAVVRASVEVSLVVLRRRPARNAVVRVDLASDSDLVLTGVATMLSLVPGSVVVDVRRSTRTLFLHVLDTPDAASVERFRAEAATVERRFVAAFVPREETP